MSDVETLRNKLKIAICDVDDREDCTIEVASYTDRDDETGRGFQRWSVSVEWKGDLVSMLERDIRSKEQALKLRAAYEDAFDEALHELRREECDNCQGSGVQLLQAGDGVSSEPCVECGTKDPGREPEDYPE